MGARQKLIYIFPKASSFVLKDIALLKNDFEVSGFEFATPRKWQLLPMFLKQFVFLVKHLRSADIVVCMFGGFHSLLPALLCRMAGKPCLIMPGGTDCVKYPKINYGNFNRRFQGAFTRWSFRLAAHLAPVSASLARYENNYSDAGPVQQGYLAFCPGLAVPATEVCNGYDDTKWRAISAKEKGSLLTVAFNIGCQRINYLKGISLITEVAPFFPENKFYLAGCSEAFMKEQHAANIVKLPALDAARLLEYYSRTEFYLQLSVSEGFPNALCEAMLCECVPVVSNISSMPSIVGETGFVLNRYDPEMLRSLLQFILSSPHPKSGKAARERISLHYTETARQRDLLTLIKRLTTV